MNIYSKIITLAFVLSALDACTNDDNATGIEDELLNGAYVSKVDFEDGDEDTRSTFVFDANQMVGAWEAGDLVGIYATASTDGTPSDENAQQSPFKLTASGTGYIYMDFAGAGEYEWTEFKRTAYFPYDAKNDPTAEPAVSYKGIPFSFKGQKQTGGVNMTAYYNGTGSNDETDPNGPGYQNITYKASEAAACAHLGAYDFMIAPEQDYTVHENTGIGYVRFPMNHVGAIARFFLLAPKEKLRINKMRLVASEPVFYTDFTADLSSHNPVSLIENGVRGDNCQITPVGDKTAVLELDFPTTAKPYVTVDYNATTAPYGHYLLAYMMMYPVDLSGVKELYLYVEAETLDASGNPTGKIKNYRTSNLEKKVMSSGKYYQWKYKALDDDHPIELTATVIPWQDVVGGSISTGDE